MYSTLAARRGEASNSDTDLTSEAKRKRKRRQWQQQKERHSKRTSSSRSKCSGGDERDALDQWERALKWVGRSEVVLVVR